MLILGLPLIIPLVIFSEKRRKTILHRLGLFNPAGAGRHGMQKPVKSRPVWMHALSVGEVLSAVPLAERLKKCIGSRDLYFSASTKTGYAIAEETMKEVADTVFFFPYDLIPSVRRRVKQIDPAMVIIVETDIWPNFLNEMKKKQIPVLLVNARLSEKSFAGYRRLWFFLGPLFLTFKMICVQTQKDGNRFRALGVPEEQIVLTGNVKFDQEENPVAASELEALRQAMHIRGPQKIFLAGSTHDGEETILLDAFIRLKKMFPNLLLMVVPRDPGRAEIVFRLFKSNGFSTALMKELKASRPHKALDVINMPNRQELKVTLKKR